MKTSMAMQNRAPRSFGFEAPIIAAEAWQSAKAQLADVEEILKDYCRLTGILGEAANYHISTGGKRFRPLFSLAIMAAMNADRRSAQQLASAVELLHNASLVHDDLQDRDVLRRGRQTVWRRYGTEMAVNLGDLFISSTYSALARIGGNRNRLAQVVALFAESTRQIIAGQSEEIRLTRQIATQPHSYLRIAQAKSGVLMSLPVVSAMTLIGSDSETITNARQAMESLGVAYQIQDDLSDLFGSKDGRAAGVDLREGRMSLPIINFMTVSNKADRGAVKRIIMSETLPTQGEFKLALNKIRSSQAICICEEEIELALQKAVKHIDLLSPVLKETVLRGMNIVISAMGKLDRIPR